MTRPLLALTVGDPSGIGPEIALRLLAEADGALPARLLLVGDRGVLERQRSLVPGGTVPPSVPSPEAFRAADDLAVALWEPLAPLDPLPRLGEIDGAGGRACYEWVCRAAELAKMGTLDGLVTGPIHKAAWRRGGVEHPGHTETLRDVAGVPRVMMLLTGGRLKVALATIHVALRDVPQLLTEIDLVEAMAFLSAEVARWFGPARPRIAVAGLNPHAGEAGLFGREEIEVIEPAVEKARGLGVDAHGPLPADACLPAAAGGGWDVVLAMYHDQALPVVKALAPRRAVNVTLGLPFVRTSVDHGTAFDRAGRGDATASSLRAALECAVGMVERGRREDGG